MVPWRRSLHAVLVLGAVVLSLPALAQSPNPGCEPWAARLLSYQGTLTGRRSSGMQLVSVSINDTFCVGDVLEIGAFSRAAIQLPDQTVVRLDQGTIVTFAAPQDDKRTWLDILKGVIHVISRDPRALRVVTPFANAGIEGTEFLVRVDVDTTTVLVYEGSVKVANLLGETTAGSGQSVLAQAGRAPVLQQVVRPRDQVVWTLYYPPLSSLPPVGAASAATPTSLADLLTRAEQRLAVGRITEAEADLAEALKLEPGSAEVLARQSVIALTRNDAATATGLADRAVATTPGSASARLAQSYARQSAADLPGAVATLESAAGEHPDNALVRARLAELYLASGDVKRSEASARAAVAADPTLGLAQSILGFAKLTRVQLSEARAAFKEAIRLEPNAPLPRLGLGLAKIRDGDLAAGREEIETAVILDPNNSLVRSYMGKAYYEEKRDGLAESQLAIAKELDPNDPTPWFYDAIRKQTVNRPVEALGDLQKSSNLNDTRGVYRSGLLLDDDAAARNAGVSAIYNELGFPVLSVVEGTDSLAENFGNSSAHLLLANAYADLPRYDISRVSEALQAQIRQPLSVPPINLRESTDNQIVAKGIAAGRVGVNEYNSLFNRDQLRLEVDGTVGSLGTQGDQVVLRGLEGRTGFALSQLHYKIDGYAENSAAEKNVYDGFVQYQVSPATSIELDARYSDYSLGYTFYSFDPVYAPFPIRTSEESGLYRFNGHHEKSPGSDWIWTLGYEDRRRETNEYFTDELYQRTNADTYVAEVQRLDRVGDLQVISGGGYISSREKYPPEGSTDTDNTNVYAYSQWSPRARHLTLIGGFALDVFQADREFGLPSLKRHRLSPKLGLVWTPLAGTTVRAAAFQSLRRPLMADQTIEPTQVASFNQFFTGFEQFYGDPEGTVSKRLGLAVDQAVTTSIFAGFQGALRHLQVPYLFFEFDDAGDPSFKWVNRSWREKSASAYVYKTIAAVPDTGALSGWSASLSLSAEYEGLSRPQDFTGSEGILDLEAVTAPFGLTIFSPSGAGFRIATSYVDQDGNFSVDAGNPVFRKNDHGWITDVLLQFRLPDRYGILSVGARNVFDNNIDVLETDPLNPRVATKRLVTGSFSLTF